MTQTAKVTAADVRVIVVMITVVVPRVAETTVAATLSAGETTVEEMSAGVVMTNGVVMSAEQIQEGGMIGAAIETAGRSKAAVGGGKLLKLAPRLCRGYLLQLLIRSLRQWLATSCGRRFLCSVRRR